MKKDYISLFTPCYNEEGNLRRLYERVTSVMETIDCNYEWVLSDNCSTDKTREILADLAKQDKRVKVIFNTRNFGPGRSGAHGFFQTSGDASICFAADLQDPPELIPRFIEKWRAGSKVVLGRVTESGENSAMYAIRGLFYRIINALSDKEETERTTGFGLYDAEVVDMLRKEQNPEPNFRFSITSYGVATDFVRYQQPAREAGVSSYNFVRRLDTALDSLVQTTYRPVRIITTTGFAGACIFFSVFIVLLMCCFACFSPLLLGVMLASLILCFVSLLALAVGVVGEYIVSCLKWVKKEPLVFEESRLNFEVREER